MSALTDAYAAWATGDIDAFLALFADDATFFVPGSTPVSGDHDLGAFRRVAEQVAASLVAGTHDQEVIETYEKPDGAIVVLHNVIRRDGEDIHYHSIHGYQGGVPGCRHWWLYLHEYDEFTRAWS